MPKEYILVVKMPNDPKEMRVRDAKPHEMLRAGLPLGAIVTFAQVWGADEPGQRYSQGKARSIENNLKKGFPGIQVSILDAPVLH
jgi:hypothetical protein